MKRAAILIGVDRTGDLPPLQDAANCALRLEDWAKSQNFATVKTITDQNKGSVTTTQIKAEISQIVKDGTTDQLLIYFAGHGVNIGYNELWLLSDSPSDKQAAINVRGSAADAEYCGISHVVFISDACRTAATGRLAFMTGSEIFPNDEKDGHTENPVDRFYACGLGRPSLEVRDPQSSASNFRAVYTTTLLEALTGRIPGTLDWVSQGSGRMGFVRPRPLKKILAAEVPRRLARLNLQTELIGTPDAHVASDELAWISQISQDEDPGPFLAGEEELFDDPYTSLSPDRTEKTPRSLAEAFSSLLQGILLSEPDSRHLSSFPGASADTSAQNATAIVENAAMDLDEQRIPGVAEMVNLAVRNSGSFGPTHHESGCGFKIRGDRFVDVFCIGGMQGELFERPGSIIRINSPASPGASVLCYLESGLGVVLPAIPGYLCGLTVLDGELIDVAYEPSENDGRFYEFERHSAEIRALRAVASVSTRDGVFRLNKDQALLIGEKMRSFKALDPTLAVYAAYAFYDIQRRDLIREMIGYMTRDIGACLFDLLLLGQMASRDKIHPPPIALSSFPLMSQGWALLGAAKYELPASLSSIHEELVPSPWTLFNRAGLEMIRRALQNGEIK